MKKSIFRWTLMFIAALGFVSAEGSARADAAKSLAHYIMGVSYEFGDQLADAAGEYRLAVGADPSAFPAYMRLGIVASELGEKTSALKAFIEAARLRPDDLQVKYLLALAYGAVRDFDHAAEQYEQILRTFTMREPQNAEFRIYLAQLYYSMGKPDQALAQFKEVLAIQPNNTEVLLVVGSSYLDRRERSEGVALLRRCIEAEPAHGDCLNALAYAYAEDGIQLDEAQVLIGSALAVEPDNAAYLDSFGWILFKQGKFDEALDALGKAVAREQDPTIFDHIGDVYHKMGRMDMAEDAWRKALEIDSTMMDVAAKLQRLKGDAGKKGP